MPWQCQYDYQVRQSRSVWKAGSWNVMEKKKDKQETLSQPTFSSFKLNKWYKFHTGLFKALAEETLYKVHDHTEIQGKTNHLNSWLTYEFKTGILYAFFL